MQREEDRACEVQWHYPAELPVVQHRDEILAALKDHAVVVVVSETGSGKTTQLPKMVAEALGDHPGRIGITQPRRLAAVSVARRVAEELRQPLGGLVGYQVRFDEKISEATRIKFMTDGILLAETQTQPLLMTYAAIIIDEVHERSLNIDFLLGYLKLLLQDRPDLKIVLSSATMNAEALADFFAQDGVPAPVITAAGRTYPVDEVDLPPLEDEELSAHVARAVERLTALDPQGDVLVFLPGEREIRDCAELLQGRSWHRTEILPLYARLGLQEQQRIFSPGSLRRIILATNVAETSLTIPRISSVIDSGLVRMSRWSAARGVQRLGIETISQASARQRKGRCGRVKAGVCVRLYEAEQLADWPAQTDPEMRRSALAGVILRMAALGLPELEHFPLLDPPVAKAVTDGYRTLRELGAMDKERRLTDAGRQMARMPLDPRHARMMIAARREGCLAELLPIIAVLDGNDPLERPADRQKEADAAHARWQHPQSDFMAVLRLWHDLQRFREKGQWRRNALRKYCQQAFLNMRRVLEWANVHEELSDLVKRELRWPMAQSPLSAEAADGAWQAAYEPLHRSLLAGVPRQFALWDKQERVYRSAAGVAFALFPGSQLFGAKRWEWVLAMELVETSRLWARRVARLDPTWVEQVSPHLCRYRYSEGKWDAAQGVVHALETVTCGGLEIVRNRRVHLGRVDPAAARYIFLREALLAGNLRTPCPSLQHLQRLRRRMEELEVKLRKPGLLWSEEHVLAVLEERVPAAICTAKQYHDWRAEQPQALMLQAEQVVWDPRLLELEQGFPDELHWLGEEYPVYYAMKPGERDDGVTIGVHIDQLQDFPVHGLEWGVPGWLEERVEWLVRSLPKDVRRGCQPISDFVQTFIDRYAGFAPQRSLFACLEEMVKQRVPYAECGWQPEQMPPEMQVKCWVCDDEGQEMALDVDIERLQQRLAGKVTQRLLEHASDDWQREGLKAWPDVSLPEQVAAPGGMAFPALVDEGSSVGVRVFAHAEEAAQAHRLGCARLMLIMLPDQRAHWLKQYPIGLAARVELPRLCAGGLSMDDLLLVAAEGAIGAPLPRGADVFLAALQRARGRWFDAAQVIGRALDTMTAELPMLHQQLEDLARVKATHEIARDIEEQLRWLQRPQFVRASGYERVALYERSFAGIQQRLARLKSLPLVKDLEKMERLRELWSPWFRAWQQAPQDARLWALGWHIEDWRVSLFAPTLPQRPSLSEKKLRVLLEDVIGSQQ